jgi:hypothetical protein
LETDDSSTFLVAVVEDCHRLNADLETRNDVEDIARDDEAIENKAIINA